MIEANPSEKLVEELRAHATYTYMPAAMRKAAAYAADRLTNLQARVKELEGERANLRALCGMAAAFIEPIQDANTYTMSRAHEQGVSMLLSGLKSASQAGQQ